MFAITMHGLYWNAPQGTFAATPTTYDSEGEAAEVAQEAAGLLAEWPWSVVRVSS